MKYSNRCMAYIIAFLMLFTCVAPLSVSADESDYTDLLVQRQAYLKEKYGDVGRMTGENYWCHTYLSGVDLTVLLYTDDAKEWTFEKCWHGADNDFLSASSRWFSNGTAAHAVCPQIDAALNVTDRRKEWCCDIEYSSYLRKCIQYFNITKEELKEANRRMQEEPDSIREMFSYLSDIEFEYYRKDNGLFCVEPLADFMIEALYLEDDEVANNMICEPHVVYVKDIDAAMSMRMFWDDIDWNVDDVLRCDLTSDWMGRFLEFASKQSDIDLFYHELNLLIAAREAQLAAKETGDGAVQGVIVLALAIPALAATFILRCKKRI